MLEKVLEVLYTWVKEKAVIIAEEMEELKILI